MTEIERAWYKRAKWLYLLAPLSWLFQLVTAVRRKLLQRVSRAAETPVPIIVVGNISVGGTGKTPLLMHLCQTLSAHGYAPGVISRGYGGRPTQVPMLVTEQSDPAVSGDEPALIASTCHVPVVVDPDRLRAYHDLVNNHAVDVVLSDDGLQHYRLPRHLEIAVVDGQRLVGNGFCLPAGPLREPLCRFRDVDFVVVNGKPERQLTELQAALIMQLVPRCLVNLVTGEERPFSGAPFEPGSTVQALAGIGNPQRFFAQFTALSHPLHCFPFPDHHRFTAADLVARCIDPSQPIVMTEKDGIKCRSFATDNFWVLKIDVSLPAAFTEQVVAKLEALTHPAIQDRNHAG